MDVQLRKFPCIVFNCSQPIRDNVEEAGAGVNAAVAVKIFSIGFLIPDSTANAVMDELKKVKGIEDLGVLRNPGYLNFVLNWISR